MSYNQFAIVFGMFVVYFVNYFIAGQGDDIWNVQNGWRWMFGSEALPALFFFGFLLVLLMGSRKYGIERAVLGKELF